MLSRQCLLNETVNFKILHHQRAYGERALRAPHKRQSTFKFLQVAGFSSKPLTATAQTTFRTRQELPKISYFLRSKKNTRCTKSCQTAESSHLKFTVCRDTVWDRTRIFLRFWKNSFCVWAQKSFCLNSSTGIARCQFECTGFKFPSRKALLSSSYLRSNLILGPFLINNKQFLCQCSMNSNLQESPVRKIRKSCPVIIIPMIMVENANLPIEDLTIFSLQVKKFFNLKGSVRSN